MLRPPSEYVLTKINLVSQPAKIDNLAYDRAIILFTPKVADKGLDLASLTCTIVQITDRGAWGKEEESFTVDASSPNNRKRREFDLTTDAEYSLKIIPPPGLRMGILEIYFDPTIYDQSGINLPIMGTTNPISSDPAALTNALLAAAPQLAQQIGTQSGVAVQQALANQASAEESRSSNTAPALIKAWSGDINNHQIYPDNPRRLGTHLMHPGKNFAPTNISDVFIHVGSPAGVTKDTFDYVMNANGEFNSDPERETMPVYAWLAPGKPDTTITKTEYLP
jgi:hypothetical protein